MKALAGNDIASVNVNKDKQADESVVSTISITTKRKSVYLETRKGATSRTPASGLRGRVADVKEPYLNVSGKNLTILRDGNTQVYRGTFHVTDLSQVPDGAVFRLDGKPANRQQILAAKKLRRMFYHTGATAMKQSGANWFLDCYTRK